MDLRQHLTPVFARENQVEGLRCGYQYMGRVLCHPGPGRGGRIARPDLGPYADLRNPRIRQLFLYASERPLKVFFYIVAQGLERGDVNDLRFIREPPFEARLHQIVDR